VWVLFAQVLYPTAPRGKVRPPPPVGLQRIEINGAGRSAGERSCQPTFAAAATRSWLKLPCA
jgi:hypothetical protein